MVHLHRDVVEGKPFKRQFMQRFICEIESFHHSGRHKCLWQWFRVYNIGGISTGNESDEVYWVFYYSFLLECLLLQYSSETVERQQEMKALCILFFNLIHEVLLGSDYICKLTDVVYEMLFYWKFLYRNCQDLIKRLSLMGTKKGSQEHNETQSSTSFMFPGASYVTGLVTSDNLKCFLP